VNGILARYLDFMDVYWAKDICHPAENIPLALACVESVKGSGRALIEAVVAGYEAQLRLTHALSFTDMGMHHVSAAGIVSPLIIGKAWGLEAAVIEQAVALGGCRQLALHALSRGGLSMAKAIGYPWSAMSSVLATRLAQGGFTGPVDFIDWLGNAGPLKSAVDREALRREGSCMIERVSFKQFPVQFELQTPVEVALRLRAGIRVPAADIAAVEIHVLPGTITRTADPAKFVPANRETADHSLPVCVAMALLDGKLTTAQFEKDRWSEPDVAALVRRTKVFASDEYARRYPDGRPAGMDVHLADGRILTEFQDAPSGDATRPLDDRALERKFLLNAAEKLGEARAAQIAECVRHLENLADVGELTRLLEG
jgi:2-methylcitrate dehydratase